MGKRGEGYVIVQLALFAAIGLAPLVLRKPVAVPLLWFGGVVLGFGALFGLWALWSLGRNLTPLPAPVPNNQLRTDGPYAIVRHPIYTAVLIGSVGYAMVTGSPLSMLAIVPLAVLFDLKTRQEERWLIEKHPAYAAYQARVKKLIPWVY